ncbi:unnamed protein product [Citrullus colocynthis]|uniref:Uncharacterized protein n=1 Tax=Citrullus colocynthis TaxID=252529 RepID=A0ABP0ZAC0_9ROSI
MSPNRLSRITNTPPKIWAIHSFSECIESTSSPFSTTLTTSSSAPIVKLGSLDPSRGWLTHLLPFYPSFPALRGQSLLEYHRRSLAPCTDDAQYCRIVHSLRYWLVNLTMDAL